MSKREKMKERIIAIVSRSGIALRTQKIESRIALPDDMVLVDLLNELVAEGRLTRRFTLLNNGDTDQLYNIRLAP